jgi:DNA-binding beta-propeller fold protein YncE
MKKQLLALCVLATGCTTTVIFPPDGGNWPPDPVPPFSHQERILITDNADDTLAVASMDLPKPKLLGFEPLGENPVELEGPHHIAASPDGNFVYVPISNYIPGSGSGPHGSHGLGTVPGTLFKIRTDNYIKTAEVQVAKNPGDVILTKDGKTAFVSHYDLLALMTQQSTPNAPIESAYSSIVVVDTDLMRVTAETPVCVTGHGMVLSPDEKTLYVACTQTDQLGIYDIVNKTATRVQVGPSPNSPGNPTYAPYTITASPSDGTLWISCNRSADVRVYDPAKGAMDASRTVLVGGVAMFGAFLPDGKTLLVPHQGDDKISWIDTTKAMETFSLGLPMGACLNAHVIQVTPDGKTGYLICEGDHTKVPGTLVTIDIEAKSVGDFVQLGLFSDGLVVVPPVM